MDDFTTLRPTQGLVGAALADDAHALERLLATAEDHLDQGEGWATRTADCLTWFVSRLAVVVSSAGGDGPASLRSDIEVVSGVAEGSDELLVRLNDLNAHAAGWFFWFDTEQRRVVSTMRCPVVQREWWWCWNLLLGIQHQATVAESIADELAAISGGTVGSRAHPERGIRPGVDGWVVGARLGAREPSASLDLFLTTLDYARIRQFMEQPTLTVTVRDPLLVEVADDTGRVIGTVSRHWHPEHGWGWQFATMPSPRDDSPKNGTSGSGLGETLVRQAAVWNARLALSDSPTPLFGGFVGVPGVGLVHHTFVPGPVAEHIVDDAGETAGFVIGLMASRLAEAAWGVGDAVAADDPGPPIDQVRDSLALFQLRIGPIGWSYAVDRADQPLWGTNEWGNNTMWLVPRAVCVCSFGIFNPSGPSVGSLELGFDGQDWMLFFVLRHPFTPAIELLGRAALADPPEVLGALISDALAEVKRGLLGDSPDWLHIVNDAHAQDVLDGVRRFAESSLPEMDLGRVADSLIGYAGDPWERLRHQLDEIELSDRGRSDPVSHWIDAVTDPDSIAGHQLFIRSAWDGARALAQGGPDEAGGVSSELIFRARNRALADLMARNEEWPQVKHPRI